MVDSFGGNCFFILLKGKCGVSLARGLKNIKSEEQTEVLPGSLLYCVVQELLYGREYEFETLNEAPEGEPPTSVRLYCILGEDVSSLTLPVLNLLRPISNCKERLEVFNDESWLNDGKKLQVGDSVYVKLKGELSEISGVVRYKGTEVPGSKGIIFGVELEENKGTCEGQYRGIQFFRTRPDHAVYVALNKVRRYRDGWQMKTRMRVDMEQNDILPQASKSSGGAAGRKLPLDVGERVVWMSDTGPEKGVVKWIGCLPGDYTSNITVGVEFDRKVGSGTGKYNNERLFFAKQGHASLVPVMGLMKESAFESPGGYQDDYEYPDFRDDPQLYVNLNKPSSSNPSSVAQHHHLPPQEVRARSVGADYADKRFANYQTAVDDAGRLMGLRAESSTHPALLSRVAMEGSNHQLQKDLLLAHQMSQLQPSPGGSSGTNPLYEHARLQEKSPGYLPTHNSAAAMSKLPQMLPGNNNKPQVSQVPDPDLDVGSLVQVQAKTPLYGTIRWIGYTDAQSEKKTAGLEMEEELSAGTDGVYCGMRYFTCPPKKGFFVPLYRCSKDRRYNFSSNSGKNSNDFGDQPTPDLPGDIAPPEVTTQAGLKAICGKNRGIQGHHNSCYLDATLFSMFYFSNVFDNIFNRPANELDLPEYPEVQKVLKEGIVNPLRKSNYVRADKVLRLRELLDKLGTVPGMMGEEKDPEEFLNALLTQIMKADPILHLSTGQHAYFYQLFIEEDKNLLLPTTQKLVELSFLQGNVKLKEVPPCLMIQMPRFGKDYKMFHRIVPSLELDITDIVENCPRDCIVCGGLARFECKDCYQVHGPGLNTTAFCEACMRKSHKHKSRSNHQPKPITISEEFLEKYESKQARILQQQQQGGGSEGDGELTDEPDIVPVKRETMELFAVICIQTSHYVSFVKCGLGPDAPWVFFDSMADRMGEQGGYNIPEVVHVPKFADWLDKNFIREFGSSPNDRELPEHLRRVLCDGYMCMYQSTSVMMYH